jgi:hypothetical protein
MGIIHRFHRQDYAAIPAGCATDDRRWHFSEVGALSGGYRVLLAFLLGMPCVVRLDRMAHAAADAWMIG